MIKEYLSHIISKITLSDEFECYLHIDIDNWIVVISNDYISDEKLKQQLFMIKDNWELTDTSNSEIESNYVYFYRNGELKNDAIQYMRKVNLKLLL